MKLSTSLLFTITIALPTFGQPNIDSSAPLKENAGRAAYEKEKIANDISFEVDDDYLADIRESAASRPVPKKRLSVFEQYQAAKIAAQEKAKAAAVAARESARLAQEKTKAAGSAARESARIAQEKARAARAKFGSGLSRPWRTTSKANRDEFSSASSDSEHSNPVVEIVDTPQGDWDQNVFMSDSNYPYGNIEHASTDSQSNPNWNSNIYLPLENDKSGQISNTNEENDMSLSSNETGFNESAEYSNDEIQPPLGTNPTENTDSPEFLANKLPVESDSPEFLANKLPVESVANDDGIPTISSPNNAEAGVLGEFQSPEFGNRVRSYTA